MSLNSPNEPLLASQRRSMTSSLTLKKPNDPIQQYNHVMCSYNFPENQIDGIYLEEMRESSIYTHFWKIFSKPVYLISVICLTVIPVLGIFIYGTILISVISYLLGLRTFKANYKKVENPFRNMIFSPELCKITKTSNKFYEIKVQDLEGFSFNSEVLSLLKVKETQGTIRFMVYNTMFWSYYHNYETHKARHFLTLLTSTAFFAVQIVIIDLIVHVFSQ